MPLKLYFADLNSCKFRKRSNDSAHTHNTTQLLELENEFLKKMAKATKKLKCPICDKKFVQSEVKRHVKTVHERIKD